MATRKRITKPRVDVAVKEPTVEDILGNADLPLREGMEEVRRILIESSAEIREGVKWNAPSFRTSDWFANLNNPANPRARDSVMLILHTGAKAKGITMQGRVPDPAGLLRRLAKDRAMATFGNAGDVRAKRDALQTVVREWIRHL
jgi:hypothetical protein